MSNVKKLLVNKNEKGKENMKFVNKNVFTIYQDNNKTFKVKFGVGENFVFYFSLWRCVRFL